MINRWRRAAIIAALLIGAPAFAQEPGSQMGTGGQRSPGDRSERSTTSNQGSGMSGSEHGTTGSQGSTSSSAQGTGSAGSATATSGERSGSQKALKGDLEEKIQEIHAANQAEVQLGQLGAQSAQSPEVKEYAQKLAQDHQKNDEQLQQVAQTVGATLEGKEFQKKQEDARKDLAKLQEKQGQEFDKAFMKHMVKDHEKDVKEVEKAAKEARKENHTELASFLDTTHTKLQGHLQEAKRIEKSLDQGRSQAQTGSRASDMGTGSGGAAGASGTGSGNSPRPAEPAPAAAAAACRVTRPTADPAAAPPAPAGAAAALAAVRWAVAAAGRSSGGCGERYRTAAGSPGACGVGSSTPGARRCGAPPRLRSRSPRGWSARPGARARARFFVYASSDYPRTIRRGTRTSNVASPRRTVSTTPVPSGPRIASTAPENPSSSTGRPSTRIDEVAPHEPGLGGPAPRHDLRDLRALRRAPRARAPIPARSTRGSSPARDAAGAVSPRSRRSRPATRRPPTMRAWCPAAATNSEARDGRLASENRPSAPLVASDEHRERRGGALERALHRDARARERRAGRLVAHDALDASARLQRGVGDRLGVRRGYVDARSRATARSPGAEIITAAEPGERSSSA